MWTSHVVPKAAIHSTMRMLYFPKRQSAKCVTSFSPLTIQCVCARGHWSVYDEHRCLSPPEMSTSGGGEPGTPISPRGDQSTGLASQGHPSAWVRCTASSTGTGRRSADGAGNDPPEALWRWRWSASKWAQFSPIPLQLYTTFSEPLPWLSNNHCRCYTFIQSLHTDLILCLHWRDYRLREAAGVEEFQVRSKHQIDRFWTPPVFFRNALSVKRLVTLQSNEYIIVSLKQKSLRYCSRLKVHFECIFRLSNFPFDSQKCHFELQSSSKMWQFI